MRLIDADELEARVINFQGRGKKTFLEMLASQPTAYEPDKVVEQLEEKADEANDKWMAYGQEDDYFDGKEDGIREAIEIVKGECNE